MTDISKVIIIVGRRRAGKTTTTKRLIKNVHRGALLLHDVSHQYGDIYKEDILPFDEFKKKAIRVSKGVVVFEEASITIGHAKQEDIIQLIATCRFKETSVIMVFHSLRLVPRYCYDMADILIMHKTKDNAKLVNEKFEDEEMTKVWTRVNANANKHYSEIFEI